MDNLLAEAFDNRGFADPCFAQKNGVVFRASAEYLYQSFDFVFSSDHGVKFVVVGQLCQVSAETIECGSFAFWFSGHGWAHLHTQADCFFVDAGAE